MCVVSEGKKLGLNSTFVQIVPHPQGNGTQWTDGNPCVQKLTQNCQLKYFLLFQPFVIRLQCCVNHGNGNARGQA